MPTSYSWPDVTPQERDRRWPAWRECRSDRHHTYDNPLAATRTCARCGMVRRSVMIHVTETSGIPGSFIVVCRCGWGRTGFETRDQARAAGDEHLAEANADG